jgi:hypothetical protein
MLLVAALATTAVRGESPSRVPQEDALRPLTTHVRQTVGDEDILATQSPRTTIAVRRQSQIEKITWHLDDSPAPKLMKLIPATARSEGTARKGQRYPVQQAGGQEPLQLQPATELDEPTPLEEVPPGEIIEEYAPLPAVPSRPRSSVSGYQPKPNANGAAPDFKCPSREELMKSICELDVNIAPSKGELPRECPLFADACEPRMWCDSLYTWKASSLCHKPLYFEHMSLERYGHTWHPFFQPVVSGAHFFGTIPILPYKMGIEDPCECVYALGYYRPGNCAPKLLYPLPLSLRGAVYEAAAVTGVVFLLP